MGKPPRSNKHGRKRSYTDKYDDLHDLITVTRITAEYDPFSCRISS